MATKSISEMLPSATLTGNELLEVSKPSETVKVTGITLSAAAADNSYNDSGDGFITAGFAVNDKVNVIGFATGANNIITGIVTAILAGKMTIGGTDGDVIVDEAVGETVTIAKWISGSTNAKTLSTTIVVTDASTARVISASDDARYIRFTNAAAKTLNVDANATVPLSDNSEFNIRNIGVGDLTITKNVAVTINPPKDGTLVLQTGMTATLKRVAVDEFDLIGQTVAA